MKTLEQYTKCFSIAMKNGGALPASARMDIEGIGVIHIANGVVTNEEVNADCIMHTTHETYDKLFHGQADPAIVFAQGQLQINGDMGVALAMGPLFEKARSA